MWQSLGPWLHFFAFLRGWPCEQSKFMINDIITFWNCISYPFLIVYIKALKASQLGKLSSSLDRAEEESQGQEQAQLQKTCRGRQQNTHWASWQLYICLLMEPATLQSSWCEGRQRQSLLFLQKIFLGGQLWVSDKAWPRAKQDLPVHWGSQTSSCRQR